MSIEAEAKRINGEMLRHFVGSTVCIVGRIDEQSGGSLAMMSCDGQKVEVVLSSEESVQGDNVEIVGVVQSDLKVHESSHVVLSAEFVALWNALTVDFDLHDKMIRQVDKYRKDLFE